MRRVARFFTYFFFSLFLLIVAAAGGAYYFYVSEGPLREKTTVVVPKNVPVSTIARTLKENDVIGSAFAFRVASKLTGAETALRAGEYAFAPHVSLKQVIDKLLSGRTVIRTLTVAEGLTSWEVVQVINEAPALEGRITSIPKEGSLLPETYHYSYGDSRASIISRMQTSMDEALAEAWEKRDEKTPLKSPEELLILASIIEKETSLKGERKKVASVFINRLRKDMKLQSDPTVIYALTTGRGPLDRRLLRKDLNEKSLYNTYRVKGLPPGPIANPGEASLMAAANPANTNYFYFVADGTGGHAFAKTFAEHKRNVAKWRKFQRSRRR